MKAVSCFSILLASVIMGAPLPVRGDDEADILAEAQSPAAEVTPSIPELEEDVAPENPEPASTPSLDLDLGAARLPRDSSGDGNEIELPSEEIRGEIEKPEIFFLLPRAKDRSGEQMIRARIRREIVQPLIKDWLEEELMLR